MIRQKFANIEVYTNEPLDENLSLKKALGPVVLALGFFDGVHLGHQELLRQTKRMSEEIGARSCVLTFINHPLTEIFPRYTPFLLMDNEVKAEKILNLGIDCVLLIPFTNNLRKYSPKKFLKEVLLNRFNLKGVVAGFNYTFGYKGQGDAQRLVAYGLKYGFEVEIIKAFHKEQKRVSSTLIRQLLGIGKIEQANELLGEPYKIKGSVKSGKQLGRKYQIPTANLDFNQNLLLPQSGVYFTRFTVDGKTYDGLTNLGYNPTFEKHPYAIETYIYDFDQDIYGKEVELEFLKHIRGEIKFSSLEELFNQIHQDILTADMLYRRPKNINRS